MEGFLPPSLSSYLHCCPQLGSLPCVCPADSQSWCEGGDAGGLGAVTLLFCFVLKGMWQLSTLPFSSDLTNNTASSSKAPAGLTEEISFCPGNIFPLCFWNEREQAEYILRLKFGVIIITVVRERNSSSVL
ncbi:unnamed protein product [Pipistrellus nathusii]|uniref:Uncharacterized protein n=1 Tax=Pipistrellus nathusii TaxID=59473 RepID=A0ABN9ZP20_PIPNA